MRRSIQFALGAALAVFAVQGPAAANVVTDWNKTAIETILTAKWSSIRGARAMAIVQAAVFDAVNATDRRYKPYIFRDLAPAGASAVAAASEAAFKTLVGLAPDQEAALAAKNEAALAGVDPLARAAGVAVGDAAAAAIMADRAEDGFDETIDPAPPSASAPGVYQPTGPGPMFPLRFPRMHPFGFADSAQFRLPPPPPLDSAQFRRDLAEVRAVGDDRASHTPEHLAIARFHAPPGYIAWNDVARQIATARDLDVAESAREFALLNFALSDAFEASFESKNAYQFWRPQTAIRSGGDPAWKSIIPAPMFAEYPCMHCAIGAAGQTVLERLAPGDFAFAIIGGGGQTRTFHSVRDYAEEEAESRILGGVHFRWSTVAGSALGKAVARNDLSLLEPMK